ncbi:hypothetical protein HPB49_004097 [Dermacentor silvarum]|uniref:Uncharacterized protein n=1 Tax=Dermacentor silvarum TaxID=543639 RepID=A0ACB8DU99_DERSI|nr:hypothetical protein HPB49_004097 [Dermacentor silvarum]
MPDDHFRRHFPLSKETVRLLREELAGELEAERATGLSVERKQASVGSEETIRRVSQSTGSECVRRVAEAVVNAGICDADMRILTVYPMRPGSDHDSFVWRTRWLRRRFQAGRIASPGVYFIEQYSVHHFYFNEGDSGYPFDPWLLSPVPGHPPMQTAEGKYNTAHATLRSIVERCIGLLMSRFRCLQRYRTLLYEPERAANIVAACAVLHTQPSAV